MNRVYLLFCAAFALLFLLGHESLLYAQDDYYVYEGIRLFGGEKNVSELQVFDISSNTWRDVRFKQKLTSGDLVKCDFFFKLRHNDLTALYPEQKEPVKVSSLIETCDPELITITGTMGRSTQFYRIKDYISYDGYVSPHDVQLSIVNNRDSVINSANTDEVVYLKIINNSDTELRAKMILCSEHKNVEDAFWEKSMGQNGHFELLLHPHSVSKYELTFLDGTTQIEYLLISYDNTGRSINVKSLLSQVETPDGGVNHVSCHYTSLLLTNHE